MASTDSSHQPSQDSNAPKNDSDSGSSSQTQSPTFGNINISGAISDSNLLTFTQAGGDINLDQSRQSGVTQTSDMEVALEALQHLKQQVSETTALNPVQKSMANAPLDMLETELKKSEPDKGLIEQAISCLKQGLEGVETLAEPAMKVASLVAKAWLIL